MPYARYFFCSIFFVASHCLAQQTLDIIIAQRFTPIIKAEVARTPAEKQKGLMHRSNMPANNGMLFINDTAEPMCMWMKNTLIPLDVAFIDDDKKIINIAHMPPHTTQNFCAAKNARYALELNRDWFKKNGVTAGDVLVFKD